VEDLRDINQVTKGLKTAIGSKLYGYEDFMAPIIAQACIQILPKKPRNFNVDNIRVAKLLGGSVRGTTLVKGYVMMRDTEGERDFVVVVVCFCVCVCVAWFCCAAVLRVAVSLLYVGCCCVMNFVVVLLAVVVLLLWLPVVVVLLLVVVVLPVLV